MSDTRQMSDELAAMLVYTIGVKCRGEHESVSLFFFFLLIALFVFFLGFNKKERYAPSHVLSLSEKRAAKTMKEAQADLLAHNRTHIVRCYPAGSRITSSNFLPHHLWIIGCQLVALNWQTFGGFVLYFFVGCYG
jgi:phosphatidylinositol phospholipase C delta